MRNESGIIISLCAALMLLFLAQGAVARQPSSQELRVQSKPALKLPLLKLKAGEVSCPKCIDCFTLRIEMEQRCKDTFAEDAAQCDDNDDACKSEVIGNHNDCLRSLMATFDYEECMEKFKMCELEMRRCQGRLNYPQ